MNMIELPKFSKYIQQPISFIQEKLNGYYMQVYKDVAGEITIFFKGSKANIWPKISKIDHLRKAVKLLPNDTSFEAEFYAPGTKPTSIPTLLNNKSDLLRIAPFALHRFGGEDMADSDISTVDLLCALSFAIIKQRRFEIPRQLKPSELTLLLKEAEVAGMEGWVLKESHHGRWFKLKVANDDYLDRKKLTCQRKMERIEKAPDGYYDNPNPHGCDDDLVFVIGVDPKALEALRSQYEAKATRNRGPLPVLLTGESALPSQ